MQSKLLERIRRWLFGPPPREAWTITHEYIASHGDVWVAWRGDHVEYASTNKSKVEDWLDQQENEAR